jgi:hypothetical protein
MERKTRRARPGLEDLESKLLLAVASTFPNGRPLFLQDLVRHARLAGIPPQDQRIAYTTPQGAHVVVTLFGLGSLVGSNVDPVTGALNLIYNSTTINTRIIGRVTGGPGRAPLASIHDASVPARSASATGSEPVDTVNLRQFDLIPGGYINLAGGVNTLFLASAGPDTQLHLAETTQPSSSSSSSSSTSGATAGGAIGGTGGAAVVGGNTGGAVALPGAAQATAKFTGVSVQIPVVAAGPLQTPPLQNPQIFGFDPAADALLRFDVATGAVLQAIPAGMAGLGTPIAGVGLGRDNNRLVVLVGAGQTIRAFDVVTGAPMGQFTTANLGAGGLTAVDGIGSTDVRTVLSDSTAGADGLLQIIDVTQSLATGQAVAAGAPFAPQREFELSGGVTGLAGSDTIYSTGAGHFDTAQPDRTQVGIIAFSTAGGTFRETSRTALPGPSGVPFIDAGPRGTAHSLPVQALGSVDGDLALVTNVAKGQNVVTLLKPSTLASDGTITLATPDRLAGLSESFHPELLDAALIDVQGNMKNFIGNRAQGLVINDRGTLNLVAINQAIDTAVVADPLLHVDIPHRQNVELISNAKRGVLGTSTRDGVVIIPGLRPAGPLTLP